MYSNFDFIFYPFLLINIDYLIMHDLCSFSRAARYSAIFLYLLGEADRAYQLLLSLWQGTACLGCPMQNRLNSRGSPCVLGEKQNICHYWYRCKGLFLLGRRVYKKNNCTSTVQNKNICTVIVQVQNISR